MAEINNTQWLEEYLKMWTPKERMGRIHKVTTFDPTYHCYPEGVYLLDDDCRAHTAIYVVDKNHNVHIIYDGMAWDLLARAVEKGLLEISLKLSEGDKGLVAVLERMLAAQNTCCAGLQAKLKKIGDELERIADAVEGGAKPKPKPDPEPEKKTLLLAEPDRHEVTEDKKVYTSAITSIVKDVPEQPWTITDDFATYPDWATVSTDKGHVYITTDGSKPGKGKNDPWNIEPEPEDKEDDLYGKFDCRYTPMAPGDAYNYTRCDNYKAMKLTGKVLFECDVHSKWDNFMETDTPKPYSYVYDINSNDYWKFHFGIDTQDDNTHYADAFKYSFPRITLIEPFTVTYSNDLDEEDLWGFPKELRGKTVKYIPFVYMHAVFSPVANIPAELLWANKLCKLPLDPAKEKQDWKRWADKMIGALGIGTSGTDEERRMIYDRPFVQLSLRLVEESKANSPEFTFGEIKMADSI